MDYKRLLQKYVHHVGDAEGCDYITDCGGLDNPASDAKFTTKEATALKQIAADVERDRKAGRKPQPSES